MKKLLLIIFLINLGNIYSQGKQITEPDLEYILPKRFLYKEDKFTGDVKISRGMSGVRQIEPFIIIRDGIATIVVRFEYSSTDWIFMEDAIIMNGDDKLQVNFGEVQRDAYGSRITESYTDFANDDLIEMLRKIGSNGNHTFIRFEGERYSDQKMNKVYNKVFKELLDFYDQITS